MIARKHLLLLLAALGTTAQGYTLNQFSQHAAVQPPTGAAVARFLLSVEAMRASQHTRYNDIGMFNGAGEPVPFSIIQAEQGTSVSGKNQLALIPITLQREGAKKSALRDTVMAEITLDGIVIERVRGEAALVATVSTQAGKNIVIDSNPRVWHYTVLGEPEPVAYVTLDIADKARDFSVALRIEGSDDLARWFPMAEGTIHRTQVGNAARESLRLPVEGQRARFVRVTAVGDGALARDALEGVLIEHPLSAIASPESSALNVSMRALPSAGEWTADLGARFPLFGLQLSLPQTNALANGQWSTRGAPTEPWKPLATQVLYRVRHNGKVDIQNPELALANVPIREVRLQLEGLDAAAGAPTLSARYHPVEVLFAARGAGPFTLGVGLAAKDIAPQALPLTSFSTTWSQQTRAQIPVASAEALRANATVAAATAPSTWRTTALWFGGGVGTLLALIALARNIHARASKPKERVAR
jgi:Protein of unknown function (DUF3999)